ncbi:hypothetical protein ACEPAF_139 [Sanghuangporus sanghuang]
MPTVEEENEMLKALWELSERQRCILFSMLDDSDDDNPEVMRAEEKRSNAQDRLKRALRKRDFIPTLLQRFPRDKHSRPIRRRVMLREDLLNNCTSYKRTSEQRAQKAETCSMAKYAFNTSILHDMSKTTEADSKRVPDFLWELHFKQLEVTSSYEGDIWSELRFTEAKLRSWWRPKYPNPESLESHGWSDMKRLARRVSIRILEKLEQARSPHIKRLQMVAEECREIVLYQIIVCFSILPENIPGSELQEIFQYTVPIIYLVSQVVNSSKDITTVAIAESHRLERQLTKLGPYLRSLLKTCYLFGQKVGFDVEKYRDQFYAGKIFDYDESPSYSSKSGFIEMDNRLAGKTRDEFARRLDGIGQRQLLVSQSLQHGTERERKDSGSMNEIIRLDSQELEDLGLERFTDIAYDTQAWKGGGGYADVYEMQCQGGKKPVAVKICRPGPKSAKRIKREARIWNQLRHKHIAPLLGFVCFDFSLSSQPCLVSELYHTDLKKLVMKYGNGAHESVRHVLSEERKLKFLRDITFALDYLHASDIVHGDLRAANVLITNESLDDPSCYAVLNDFGMTELYEDDIDHILSLSSVNMQTSLPWLAPELFQNAPRQNSPARVSKEGDVYAFGAVFLEVIYERVPYKGSSSIERAKSIGEPPVQKEDLDIRDELHWTLMEACWNSVDKRPSIVEIGKKHLDIMFKSPPPSPVRHTI